ncbi:hypothetical protein [Methanoplanus limicola]|uniref:Uncharacterized protein n=1 Tax=Methanoplanus limicola DSM 2279 TaxID=937775 RepID=H1Z3W3_9EURY|nr:hypothetical protein [Methanoplanus limicola]EHQ36585.1 hypothetical protein Metlim_2542 [Methanoplanus limicola DSM 2279]
MSKTLYFERKYKQNIDNFNLTTEIDSVIEKNTGKKLKLIKKSSPVLSRGGCIFKIKDYDLENRIEKAINRYSE